MRPSLGKKDLLICRPETLRRSRRRQMARFRMHVPCLLREWSADIERNLQASISAGRFALLERELLLGQMLLFQPDLFGRDD